jgi:hypothetical protein
MKAMSDSVNEKKLLSLVKEGEGLKVEFKIPAERESNTLRKEFFSI